MTRIPGRPHGLALVDSFSPTNSQFRLGVFASRGRSRSQHVCAAAMLPTMISAIKESKVDLMSFPSSLAFRHKCSEVIGCPPPQQQGFRARTPPTSAGKSFCRAFNFCLRNHPKLTAESAEAVD
jgi:hypothetical protein